MLRTSLLLAGVAACSAYVSTPVVGVSRAGRASSLLSVRMGQAPPPDSGIPVSKAKANTLAANKAQWGIESVPPSPQTPSVASSAPAPKKAAAPVAAASGSSLGFSGNPAQFSRPAAESASAFSTSGAQTFLGMAGPRAAGHREKFGGKHAASMLAISALLCQPIFMAGNYNLPTTPGGEYTRTSFESSLSKAPGFEGKVPTLDAFLPFAKNGFTPSPVLFSAKSPLVFDKDLLGGCGAFNNKGGSCHTFFDEVGDLLTKKQEAPAGDSSASSPYFVPWVWKK